MERLGKLKMPGVGQAMGQLFPLLGLVTVIKQTMPPEGHEALNYCRRALSGFFNPFCFFTVHEFEGSLPNDLYRDIHLHLESCKAYNKAKRVILFRKPNTTNVTMRLADSSDVIVDVYKGMTVWWTHHEETRDKLVYRNPYGNSGTTTRKFHLKIRKRDKARLLPEYLDFIARNSSTYSGKTRDIKIFTNSENVHTYSMDGSRRMWEEVPYKHPSTFDTLAIEPCLKEKILADLTSFTSDQAFYKRTGRAWKRGYLLYGPPGTGKSSMIAAMANFLKYDIFDLELSQVRTNSDLRRMLIQTSNRSIIVLEDIDCSVKFANSRTGGFSRNSALMMMPGDSISQEDDPNKVTLSGLLNFVDGLWSCCGEERIFVFTTNHVEKLDKALLRPGRMDMQIELSYCTFSAFLVLAQNYLCAQDHPLFAKVESAFTGKTMTPAQIAELLIKDKSNVEIALENVISALENNVPESPAEVTCANPNAANAKVENGQDSVNDLDVSGNKSSKVVSGNKSSKVVSRKNLISTLQGVIEVLEKDADSSPSLSTPRDISKVQAVANFENLFTSSGAVEPSPSSVTRHESEAPSPTVKDLVQSIGATLVKNKSDIDSAEPKSEIDQHMPPVLEPKLNGTANGHSAPECSSPPMLENGTSPLKAVSNDVYGEAENEEIK